MKAGTKLTLAAGLGAGYVLGTRAGREQYDKIMAAVRKVIDAPAVRQTANVVQVQAFEITRNTAHKGREAVGYVVQTVRNRGDHGEDSQDSTDGTDSTNGKARTQSGNSSVAQAAGPSASSSKLKP